MTKNKKVPVLRFPGFEGEWEEKKLGETIEEKTEFPKEELPLYSLTIEEGIVPKSERYERAFLVKSEEAAYKVMSENDFAYNPMNLRFGALARFKGRGKVLVSKYYNIFRCNENVVLEFIESYLTSYNMIQYYNKMATGSLEEKKRVHFSDFIHFKRRLPTLPEQQKIAAFLTAIDTRIQQLTRKKALLEQYKKGVMQKIFSREVRFRDEEGKEYGEWEVDGFGEIAKRLNGKYDPTTDPTNYPCIELESISQETGNLLEIFKSHDQLSIKNRFSKGDVLFGKLRPYLRKYLIAGFDGVCSSEIWVLRGRKVSNEFLYYLIQTDNFINAANMSTGSKMPRADWRLVESIQFNYPTLPEQQKIATFLSALDTKIDHVTAQITRSQMYKKGLLQQMFV